MIRGCGAAHRREAVSNWFVTFGAGGRHALAGSPKPSEGILILKRVFIESIETCKVCSSLSGRRIFVLALQHLGS